MLAAPAPRVRVRRPAPHVSPQLRCDLGCADFGVHLDGVHLLQAQRFYGVLQLDCHIAREREAGLMGLQAPALADHEQQRVHVHLRPEPQGELIAMVVLHEQVHDVTELRLPGHLLLGCVPLRLLVPPDGFLVVHHLLQTGQIAGLCRGLPPGNRLRLLELQRSLFVPGQDLTPLCGQPLCPLTRPLLGNGFFSLLLCLLLGSAAGFEELVVWLDLDHVQVGQTDASRGTPAIEPGTVVHEADLRLLHAETDADLVHQALQLRIVEHVDADLSPLRGLHPQAELGRRLLQGPDLGPGRPADLDDVVVPKAELPHVGVEVELPPVVGELYPLGVDAQHPADVHQQGPHACGVTENDLNLVAPVISGRQIHPHPILLLHSQLLVCPPPLLLLGPVLCLTLSVGLRLPLGCNGRLLGGVLLPPPRQQPLVLLRSGLQPCLPGPLEGQLPQLLPSGCQLPRPGLPPLGRLLASRCFDPVRGLQNLVPLLIPPLRRLGHLQAFRVCGIEEAVPPPGLLVSPPRSARPGAPPPAGRGGIP
mmetsp:Transcript_93784/g.297604  ORF Transcript_93784/g.297604 Transcript_93784/m.297604 type:complete len:534 (+) Transcript_93784:177-1778(+)